MEMLKIDKAHDELRQGEAFAPFAVEPNVHKKKFYIESYGCAMNFADSEVVASILQNEGFGATRNVEDADLILVNTCSIREKAEATIRKRLTEFRKLKIANRNMLVGILGCMAERLKGKLLEEEKLVDIVVGPDAYRSLPSLIAEAEGGQKGVNVLLSREETYADISPIRLNSNGITAFVSIMRGCNNMCSFCVVPFTRGRERSRDARSIVNECTDLFNNGYREVTLLGQNVDSYNAPPPSEVGSKPHSITISKIGLDEDPKYLINSTPGNSEHVTTNPPSPEGPGEASGATFATLLAMVAQINPLLRVRFSTSHPKDITDDVLYTMAKYENICRYIHLPVQSGSTRVLQLMNRTYTREWYMHKVDRIREIMPDCGITSDVISGFCTETEEDHQDTLSVMEYSRYDMSYMYFYSERPGTLAERKFTDDVPLDIKKRRLHEIVAMQGRLSTQSNLNDIGKTFKVLIEGDSKKSEYDWSGRTEQNKSIVFPKEDFQLQKGDYVFVKVKECTRATLLGVIFKSSI